MFGTGNSVTYGKSLDYGVVLGRNNVVNGSTCGICLGYNNLGTLSYGLLIGSDINGSTYMGIRAVGDRLIASHNDQTIWGRLNDAPTLNQGSEETMLIIGCGKMNGMTELRKNAMEINNTQLKIFNNLQLANDTTEVNAIVAPSDPSNPTTDEQTLATKAYVDSSISVDLPMKHLANALTGLDETSFPMDFTSYWTAARASDSNMKISLRINGSCYSKSLYNCLAVDGGFECYRSAYDSGTQVTTFYRYRFGWDYQNKTLSLTGSMSWDMHDVGVVDNVNHGLTGLTITIYQIETY